MRTIMLAAVLAAAPVSAQTDDRRCETADRSKATEVVQPMLDRGMVSVDIDGVNVSPLIWEALPTVETKRTFLVFAGVYRACIWWAENSRDRRMLATTSVDVFSKVTGRKLASFDVTRGFTFY
ncbi:MAG: hypothetical protein OXE96_07965 [Gemmatimonadetes bacterium]|nr:hypothetical protein [Gemmatimonadota bacterium]